MDNQTKPEKKALKTGNIKAGFKYDSGALLWIFQFYDAGRCVFSLDCPFDARIILRDQIQLHDITNQNQQLLIEIYAIDNGITTAIRGITMPPAQTLLFLAAVQDQLGTSEGPKIINWWLQMQPETLARTVDFYKWGE